MSAADGDFGHLAVLLADEAIVGNGRSGAEGASVSGRLSLPDCAPYQPSSLLTRGGARRGPLTISYQRTV